MMAESASSTLLRVIAAAPRRLVRRHRAVSSGHPSLNLSKHTVHEM
jgi:hypothetical protein